MEYGWYDMSRFESGCLYNTPSTQDVEETVRTHMYAGHTAKDLIADCDAKRAEFQRWVEEYRAKHPDASVAPQTTNYKTP